MGPEFNIIFLIIISTVGITGILANTFIVILHLVDWAKCRHLNTCGHILLTLGISSTFFKVILLVETYLSITCENGYNNGSPVMVQLKMWSAFSTYLLTACLCVFYCVKIVDFHHPFFIWIKLKISKVVPWLLLASVVGSLVLSFPVYWSTFRDVPSNSSTNLTNFSTTPSGKLQLQQEYIIVSHVLGFFLPLLLGMASITLILASLCRHTRRMKENASGFSQPRLEAHYGAAKMVGSLLMIYIPLLLGEALKLPFASQFWVNHAVWIIIVFSCSAHSMILILGNTKLRQAFWNVLSTWTKVLA